MSNVFILLAAGNDQYESYKFVRGSLGNTDTAIHVLHWSGETECARSVILLGGNSFSHDITRNTCLVFDSYNGTYVKQRL